MLGYQVTDLFPKKEPLSDKLNKWKWLKQSGYLVTVKPSRPIGSQWMRDFEGLFACPMKAQCHGANGRGRDGRTHSPRPAVGGALVTQAAHLSNGSLNQTVFFLYGGKIMKRSQTFYSHSILGMSVTNLLLWPLAFYARRGIETPICSSKLIT